MLTHSHWGLNCPTQHSEITGCPSFNKILSFFPKYLMEGAHLSHWTNRIKMTQESKQNIMVRCKTSFIWFTYTLFCPIMTGIHSCLWSNTLAHVKSNKSHQALVQKRQKRKQPWHILLENCFLGLESTKIVIISGVWVIAQSATWGILWFRWH